ncbi:MAG: hypothetical protein JWO36_929 [Myxococcales bacterium]|nr:hypothetical protein [Myxococcales bacterium]
MSVAGTVKVRCPACKAEQDTKLVQSINTRKDPDAKQRLVKGELNVLVCACGKQTQLAANVFFHDPDADYYCQVCPGGDAAMIKAAETFRAVGATGTQRLVPSLNALIEKVKLLDANLQDWAIEMTKVLLLASIGVRDLDRVLLFDTVDRAESVIRWVLFDERGRDPKVVASPLPAYDKLAARTASKPAPSELQIDRVWGTRAVEIMITNQN